MRKKLTSDMKREKIDYAGAKKKKCNVTKYRNYN